MSFYTSNKVHTKEYRPDIDGLRAIAVLAVALYHADIPYVTGGYVGVDIFFVISGYLITKTISSEVVSGNFSIFNFYLRRSARILPSFIFVVVSVWIAGAFVLFKGEMVELAKDIESSAFFVLNIFLNRQAGDYFHSAFELKPLLHIWSLSVEEQFYIFWPWLIFILHKRKANIRSWILVVTFISLVASLTAVYHNDTKDAFFLIQYRAWELSIGAFLAAGGSDANLFNDRARNYLSVIGFFLVVCPILAYTKFTPFPGLSVLMPVTGAVLLIYAGPSSLLNKILLSNKILVGIGLVSYAFYLWHWPLLAFLRIINVGDVHVLWGVVALITAFFLAVISTKFVESPIRDFVSMRIIRGRSVLAPMLVSLILIVSIFSLGRYVRENQDSLGVDMPSFPSVQMNSPAPCYVNFDDNGSLNDGGCLSSAENVILVWGDSHAGHYGLAMQEYAHLAIPSATIVIASVGGCPPFPGVERIDDNRNCSKKSDLIFDYVVRNREVKTVVLAARFVAYAKSLPFGKTNVSAPIQLVELSGATYPNQEDLVVNNIKTIAENLVNNGKKVLILGEVPMHDVDVFKCYARKGVGGGRQESCEILAKDHFARYEAIEDRVFSIAKQNRDICFFSPTKNLCSGEHCITTSDGTILYSDDNHMNVNGAKYLSNIIQTNECL